MAKRKPGEVRDAIVAFLRGRKGADASVAEIRTAVEEALGGPVAASSVRSYLQLNDQIENTARGRWRWSGSLSR